MPFQLSPGVSVTEKDLTNIVPAVSTSVGAFAGTFVWGPVLEPTQVTSENNLVAAFGRPKADNATSFFTAANFLAYSGNLYVTRVATEDQKNAVATKSGGISEDMITITDGGSSYETAPNVAISAPDLLGGVQATATAVLVSNAVDSITVDIAGTGYTSPPTITIGNLVNGGGADAEAEVDEELFLAGLAGAVINNGTDYDNNYASGEGTFGQWAGRYPGALGNSLLVSMADSATFSAGSVVDDGDLEEGKRYQIVTIGSSDFTDIGAVGSDDFPAGVVGEIFTATGTTAGGDGTVKTPEWEYAYLFDTVPGTSEFVSNVGGENDEVHIVVVDSLGRFSGVPGTILEKFAYASKASDARKYDGTSAFYKNVITNTSKYIYWLDFPTEVVITDGDGEAVWGEPSEGAIFTSLFNREYVVLSGGVDSLVASDGEIEAGWDVYADVERFDVSLLPLGAVKPTVAASIIQNVVERRKDCVAFVSPTTSGGGVIQGSTILQDTLDYRKIDLNVNSSYAVCDDGWKYQYDRYNDVFRWVPLNGDVAGLCAGTDDTNDPWWSPAGLNRGLVKNVTKLSFNPNNDQRDELYKAGINPIVSFPGQGVVLYGDKTLLSRPSAFDRINVRRLFIVLEKAIATAAKYQLFEFNDSFTRSQFVSMVEPFLRDVKGRRGIYDFRVVCNETNNTGEVIDRNEFVADIYVKPARSINFITLNFVAVRTGISFDEIGG